MSNTSTTGYSGLEIAIIGMSGRFPGAENIAQYWDILINGKETITFFSEEELRKSGVGPALLENENYVKAAGCLDNIEYFDASFFGYSPKEAEFLNPQTRLFYECVYEALEDAGYVPGYYSGTIGLYAGASTNPAWDVLALFSGKSEEIGGMAAGTLATKDSLPTRIAYKLNLTGPALSVSTACSTSLVAVHVACRALLTKECDIALAGGVSIENLERKGYMYHKGLTESADGHCKPFAAAATGTMMGDGAGVVVLKKLKNAMADNDHIYALIKGTALNNDGFRKVGFTAPSVEGQVEVIQAAMKMGGISPESVGFVETHGTGTQLGDTVEIEALRIAFGNVARHSCALGSVKSNFGHLEAAAGIAGLIKTVLVLKHKLIPPTLHFEAPNPEINFESSPFYVNTKPVEWTANGRPRRAGISSFGIGGTNAHALLEEAPEMNKPAADTRAYKLLLLSARTQRALERMTGNLAAHLEQYPGINLADTAYTLQLGRKSYRYRKMLICDTPEEAARELAKPSRKVKTFSCEREKPPVIFILSGQGGQYVDMGKDLYLNEPLFRREMDHAFEILKSVLNVDVKDVLYKSGPPTPPVPPSPGTPTLPAGPGEDDTDMINKPEFALSVNFIFEYALARLLIQRGVKPFAMTGYSFGEYVAACLAGVFTLEEALELVTARGRLMRKTPAGSMLSVPLREEEIKPLLESSSVSLAIINGPSCVVAGKTDDVTAFDRQMRERRLLCAPLNMFHAVHSPLMNPVRQEFEELVAKVKLNKPQIPYISNVTGTWITPGQVLNPGYWGEHLCSPVRFSDGLNELLKIEGAVFVEVGPGRLLSNILRQILQPPQDETPDKTLKKKAARDHKIINIVKHQQEKQPDDLYFLSKLGELWLYGVPIDWHAYYENDQRSRISLPTYSFDRKRHWIDMDALKSGLLGKSPAAIPGLADKLQPAGYPEEGMEADDEYDKGKNGENEEPEGDEGFDEYEDYESPRDDLEMNIAEIWKTILGFERIGIHDNFYDMNGDSLTATQMVTRLQQVYPIEIPLKAFLEKPTIADLAEVIKELLMEKIQGLSAEELDALAQQDIF